MAIVAASDVINSRELNIDSIYFVIQSKSMDNNDWAVENLQTIRTR